MTDNQTEKETFNKHEFNFMLARQAAKLREENGLSLPRC